MPVEVVEVRQKRLTSLADVHISSVIEEPIPVEVVGVLRERALFTVALYSTPTPPAGWRRFAFSRDRLCDNVLDLALIAARGETKEFRKERNPFFFSRNSRGRDLVSRNPLFRSSPLIKSEI